LARAQKFLFDTSFDPPEAPKIEPPPAEPTFSEAELDAARAEGMAAGQAAAHAEYAKTDAHRLADALNAIAASLTTIQPIIAEGLAANARVSIEIAAALARKIAGAAAAQEIAAPVSVLIGECLPRLLDEPRIVVRLAESAVDDLRGHVTQAAERAGYHGQVVLIGDPQLTPLACRIEWADGGAECDPARIAAEADAAVARFLAGLSGATTESLIKEPSHG
jgi:flagellar assembly protein FliH